MPFFCAALFHETSETPGTVETVLHPKNSQKRGKNAVIRCVFERFLMVCNAKMRVFNELELKFGTV